MSRRKARVSVLLALVIAVLAGTALFRVSQQVQTAEDAERHLRISVASEKEAIRVLDAEWDYLNRPDRLEKLSQEYLNMQQPHTEQIEHTPAVLPDVMSPVIEAQTIALDKGARTPMRVPYPRTKPQRQQPRDFQRLLDDVAPAAGGAR